MADKCPHGTPTMWDDGAERSPHGWDATKASSYDAESKFAKKGEMLNLAEYPQSTTKALNAKVKL